MCRGGACRDASLVRVDRPINQDVRKKADTSDVSPGPFFLPDFWCEVARGRAEDESDDEHEDVVVNLLHIPKFCAILREPFKRDCEDIDGKT